MVKQKYLTVFLVSLLIQEYVGLHVPDELMSQQLGLLCSPQDVFSHISHLYKDVMDKINIDNPIK